MMVTITTINKEKMFDNNSIFVLQFGHTPEYYKKNQSEFSHRSLLKEFGAEEQMAEEILSDKGNLWPFHTYLYTLVALFMLPRVRIVPINF